MPKNNPAPKTKSPGAWQTVPYPKDYKAPKPLKLKDGIDLLRQLDPTRKGDA